MTRIRCVIGFIGAASSCWFRTGGSESVGGGKMEENFAAIADDGKSSAPSLGCRRIAGSWFVTTAFLASIKASSTSLA
jgi:hypothetical protein